MNISNFYKKYEAFCQQSNNSKHVKCYIDNEKLLLIETITAQKSLC